MFELDNPLLIKITQTSTASAPSPSAPTTSQVSNVQMFNAGRFCLHTLFLYFAMIPIRDNFHLHWKCQRHRCYSAWKKTNANANLISGNMECLSRLNSTPIDIKGDYFQTLQLSNVYAVSTLKIIWREIKILHKNSKFWETLISWKNESRGNSTFFY